MSALFNSIQPKVTYFTLYFYEKLTIMVHVCQNNLYYTGAVKLLVTVFDRGWPGWFGGGLQLENVRLTLSSCAVVFWKNH